MLPSKSENPGDQTEAFNANRGETMRAKGSKKREPKPVEETDPFLRRLHDPNEAAALWRRLRELEVEVRWRAVRTADPEHAAIARIIADARIREEQLEGLPGYSSVTVDSLPARAGTERKKSVRQFQKKCAPVGQMLLDASKYPERFQRVLDESARKLLGYVLVLGIVSKGSVALDSWLTESSPKLAAKLRVQVLTRKPTAREAAMLVLEAAGVDAKDARDWTR